MEITNFDLKRVHMARCELTLRQDGAIWLRIFSKPLLDLYKAHLPKMENYHISFVVGCSSISVLLSTKRIRWRV